MRKTKYTRGVTEVSAVPNSEWAQKCTVSTVAVSLYPIHCLLKPNTKQSFVVCLPLCLGYTRFCLTLRSLQLFCIKSASLMERF